MFTIQVLGVKIESLKNECHLIIICKLGHYCLLTENCFDRSVVECKYVGWRWSQRWARWHQGWMSPWGTTIATLAIPLSTLQDASLLPHCAVDVRLSPHLNQHDEEYYREPHHTVDCAKFFQWHILLPTVQQQQKSSVEELGRLWGGLMDFQPGADDYLCDRGQIFEYTIHMSIHRWCHLIASQMLKYFETLYILHKSCLVFDYTGW